MLIKEMLWSNQKAIDSAIKQIKPTFLRKPSNTHQDFLYTSKSMTIRQLSRNAVQERPLKGEEYLAVVYNLLESLNEHKREVSIVAMQIRLDILLYVSTILDKALKVTKNDASQNEYLKKIYAFQLQIEAIIKCYFAPEFRLKTLFSLSGIGQQYNERYEYEYGQGALGFFKLPIKKIFQNSTRAAEIKFLEDVELYCEKNQTLSDDKKNQLRVSAASLVYKKILSDKHANGSLLARIIRERYEETDQVGGLHELVENFVDECRGRMINVPEHLESRGLAIS